MVSTMIHFYDTNVVIGYVYSVDPLHEASKKAILEKNDNYYSEHVKSEVKKVAFRKDREYDKFLRKVLLNSSSAPNIHNKRRLSQIRPVK